MRFFAFLIGLIALGVAAAPDVFAQAPAAGCPRAAANWTATETKVWQQLCEDGTADITPPYGRMEPPVAGQPEPENLLSATFVRQILTDLPYRDVLPNVTIAGAMVTGQLDMNKRSVPKNVTFEQSHFLEGINLEGATINGNFTCKQCYSPISLTIRTAVVTGTIDVTGTQLGGALDLGASIIDGDIRATGTSFGAFVGRGMRVKGNLDLTGARVPEVVLGGAQVIGDARLNVDGSVNQNLQAASARFGGELNLVAAPTWPTVRIDLSNSSAGSLVLPAVLPANFESRDFIVDRASPVVADWILARLDRTARLNVEAYTQLAQAATAAGNAEGAAKVLRTLRGRQRADATSSERFWMTVEDLGWISYVIGLVLVGALAWGSVSYFRRRAAE